MKLSCASFKDRTKADAIVIPFWHGKKQAEPAFSGKEFSDLFGPVLETGDFSGKEGEVYYLVVENEIEKRLVLLGLGEEKKLTTENLRRCYAHAVKLLRKVKAEKVNVVIPATKQMKKELCRGLCEGLFLTNYSFDQNRHDTKGEMPPLLKEFRFIGLTKEMFALCQKSFTIASSVYFARDLCINNADEVTPTFLAHKAKELAKDFSGIKTTVFNRKQIEHEKMGLLAAVSRGATTEPAFILIEYRGNPRSKEFTALVGKGITFDTGGLNLKPPSNMETMRDDMAGASVVLGTLRTAAELKLKTNILGVIASTENAIGPSSYKIGDVYKSHSGITVYVSDTDAEGRLVLADALSYAQEHYPLTRAIDIATLTGSVVVALGEEVSGLFSNDDKLAKALFEAGEETYERLWRMPLYSEYKELLKSKFADIKSVGGRAGGSITAALFIQRFIKKDLPWAHIDIAGTAFPTELKPYQPVQATGFGVRLLVQFLENL
ncbi:MAG TPA: leucyl aminopeptidase [Rhabdochlamydiaceae bacterium]|nr:leucyl aminopeptidase [Rhabdochlamydiaceae bacterium]